MWMANFLTGLIVATTAVQFFSGPSSFEYFASDKAGLIKSDVRDGEYWRLLTGCFMHGSLLHIFFNGSALRGLGRDVEALGGRWALPLVLLLSMISGSLFSLVIMPHADSVGASGGIMGLLGYLLIFAWRHKAVLPPGFGQSLLINLGMIAVMGVLMHRQIDNWGHLGGVLMGAICGLALIPSDIRRLVDGEAGWAQALGKASLGVLLATAIFATFKMLQH
jgi:membrane associated rhomboid family serine protease